MPELDWLVRQMAAAEAVRQTRYRSFVPVLRQMAQDVGSDEIGHEISSLLLQAMGLIAGNCYSVEELQKLAE
jgi:hypothetical protein